MSKARSAEGVSMFSGKVAGTLSALGRIAGNCANMDLLGINTFGDTGPDYKSSPEF
jgi:hypothetical protein